jgi:acetoin utilization protein AcuB
MTVDGIMSRDVVTVPPDTTLMDIRRRLHEEGFHYILVIEDGELRGVISDRDVLQALSPFLNTYTEEHRDVQTLVLPAHEVMRTDPITGAPDTEVEEASRLLLDNNISSLPVIDGNELVGIVTTKDLLNHYTNGS